MRTTRSTSRSLPMITGILMLAATAAQAAASPFLQIVVEDVRLREGATEALVVVRANAVRPLAAGTLVLDLFNDDNLTGPALAELLDAQVVAGAADAVVAASLDVASQRTQVDFSSASGTVNDSVGPIAILRYRLVDGLVDNRRFELRLRGGLTTAAATDGLPLYLDEEDGDLRIDKANADVSIDAAGGEFAPGQDVLVGAEAELLGPIASGTVELVFDPAFVAGPASALIAPAYGTGIVDSLTEPQPGHVVVTFHSPAEDLNTLLPGPFLFVSLPSSALVAPGTSFAIHLGPATQVVDPNGELLEVEVNGDTIRFHDIEHVFSSGFEDGGMDDFSEKQEGPHG